MSRTDDPTLMDVPAGVVSWIAEARRLAADGAWPDAVVAYEHAMRELGRPDGLVVPTVPGRGAEVRLWGGFELRIDGRTVGTGGLRPQHRALLQVLCLHAGRPVPDTCLGAWFWPDAEPDRVRHRVAVGVSALRSWSAAAGGPAVVRGSDGYRMVLGPVSTDVGHFERLVTDARRSHREDRLDRLGRLEAAFAAYAGPLLPGAGEAAWVVDERDRLRTEASSVAAELADIHARAGRPRDVVRVARAGLRIDRAHDRLWRRLVAALTDLAEPAAAATARREYAAVLADLGVEGPPVVQRRLHSA